MKVTIKAASLSIMKLKAKGSVEKVLYLNSVRRNPLLIYEAEYQRTFNNFYKVRQKKAEFYKNFYNLFYRAAINSKNVIIEDLLSELFEKTKERHLSFCSKILATLNDDVVIFDKNVASQFGVSSNALPKKDWEIEAKKRHDLIRCGIENVIRQSNWSSIERKFDENFLKAVNLSQLRKADLVLWAL